MGCITFIYGIKQMIMICQKEWVSHSHNSVGVEKMLNV